MKTLLHIVFEKILQRRSEFVWSWYNIAKFLVEAKLYEITRKYLFPLPINSSFAVWSIEAWQIFFWVIFRPKMTVIKLSSAIIKVFLLDESFHLLPLLSILFISPIYRIYNRDCFVAFSNNFNIQENYKKMMRCILSLIFYFGCNSDTYSMNWLFQVYLLSRMKLILN